MRIPDPPIDPERIAESALSFAELTGFLKDTIAAYKLPEFLELLDALPRTPTGEAQKGPRRDIVLERMRSRT